MFISLGSANMKSLQGRLAEIFPAPQERGLQADIKRLCKKSGATVSAWFKDEGKVGTMPLTCAELICATYARDVSPIWLAEGRGDKLATAAPPPLPSSEPTIEAGLRVIALACARIAKIERERALEQVRLLVLDPEGQAEEQIPGLVRRLSGETDSEALRRSHQESKAA